MALIHLDSCQLFAAVADIPLRYTLSAGNPAAFSSTGGPYNGPYYTLTGNSIIRPAASIDLSVATGTVLHGAFYFRPGATSRTMFKARNISSGNGFQIDYVPIGSRAYARLRDWHASAAGASLLESRPRWMDQAGPWHHIEFAFQPDNASGTAKFWVDTIEVPGSPFSGDTLLSGSASSLIDELSWGGSSGNGDYAMPIVWDETGSGFARSGQLGLHDFEVIYPSGAGTNTDFTPSAGSNFQNVDETGFHDGDTTYNEGTTANNIDSYAMGDITAADQSIPGLQIAIRVKNPDVGSASARTKLRSNGVYYNGATETLSAAYEEFVTIYELDPDDAGALTKTKIDAFEMGVENI